MKIPRKLAFLLFMGYQVLSTNSWPPKKIRLFMLGVGGQMPAAVDSSGGDLIVLDVTKKLADDCFVCRGRMTKPLGV